MKNNRLWLVAAVVLPPAALLLYLVPPTEGSFYPRCYFHALTGLHCPGCGATRCVHALMHADLEQAVAYNLLLVLALPLLVCWGLRAAYQKLRGRSIPPLDVPRWSVPFLLVLLFAFWVLRNIPVPPFDLLAPHSL